MNVRRTQQFSHKSKEIKTKHFGHINLPFIYYIVFVFLFLFLYAFLAFKVAEKFSVLEGEGITESQME